MRKKTTHQPDSSPTSPAGSGPDAPNPAQDLFRGPDDPVARRGRRVILLLAALWVLNAFDLTFTIMAQSIGHFNELNPLARQILEHPYKLIVFKLGAVFFASVVLFTYRQRRLVELSCWALGAVYVILSFVWLHYFFQNSWQFSNAPGL